MWQKMTVQTIARVQVKILGGKCEQFKGEKQEAETQSTQDAENTPKPPIVTNPTVMHNNKDNNDLIADTRNKVASIFFQMC